MTLGENLCHFLCSFILLSCGHAAPDVALGLVLIQHRLDLPVQPPVVGRQTLRQVLMHRGFADAELLGGGPDGGPVFHHVQRQVPGALLQIVFDR